MNKNNIIICILVAVIIILVVCIFLLNAGHDKTATEIEVTSNSTLNVGESISIRLTDLNNTPIANQDVNVTITSENGDSNNFKISTDDKGKGSVELKDLAAGNYEIKVKYGGNDKYSPSNTTEKLEIKEKTVESEPAPTTSSSSNSQDREDDSYWETSPDAPFEYHTEHYSDGEIRQYDRQGRLVGSTYDEDQEEVASNVGYRI